MTELYTAISENFWAEKAEFLRHDEDTEILRVTAEAQDIFCRLGEDFSGRLSAETQKILGLSLPPVTIPAGRAELKKLDILVGQAFDIHIDMLWFVIPMNIFKDVFIRHFIGLVPYEVEKNMSRLTSQLADLLNDAIARDSARIINHVETYLETAAQLLASTPNDTAALTAASNSLHSAEDQAF